MSQYIDVVARLLAYQRRRAVPIRQTSMLAHDPTPAFGIAPIRVVSEQFVQTIAFGPLDRAPRIVVTWNPMNREAGFLELFAAELDAYLMICAGAGELPRVWLPHGPALEVVDILGHRYRTNKSVTDSLRRMGWQCRALAEEATYPGQQVVAVASDLLAAHVVTGQSPTEDRHLRALLAWVSPTAGIDSADEAERQALLPAAGMLARDADDKVEQLREDARGEGPKARAAQERIETILRASALQEWELLISARRAFWGLKLPSAPALGRLVEESRSRIAYAVQNDHSPPSRPHSLAGLLDEHEYALSLAGHADVCGDALIRERALRNGKVVRAEVVRIDQPRRGYHPCTLTLRMRQEVLRVRRGTALQSLDGSITGRVEAIQEDDATGGTLIALKLDTGVRVGRLPTSGAQGEWVEPTPFDGRWMKRKIYAAMADAADPRVYSDALPAAAPRALPAGDLAAIAERLRKP